MLPLEFLAAIEQLMAAKRQKPNRPRPLSDQWAMLQRELGTVLAEAGLTVGGIPGHDCYLFWNGSSTPIILTTSFSKVIALAHRVEPLLAQMDSMWNVLVYDDVQPEDGKVKRYLISAVGSQPL